jgi:NADH dehydrogenase
MSSAEADLLVLGASMLGIELVYQVRRRAKRPVRTIVVDRQARHPYIPLCHERLCGRIPTRATELETAAYVGADPSSSFVQEEITGFDPETHVATLANGDTVRGRVVVVALGSSVAPPPGIEGASAMLTLKSIAAWERANEVVDAALRGASDDAPSIFVVGGGISGVELAGELAHLRHTRPAGWAAPAVTLVHAGERLLPGLCSAAGRRAARLLAKQGVELRLRTRLRGLTDGRATLIGADGAEDEKSTALAFWAGGLRPPGIVRALGLPTTDEGWLMVGPTLQCFPTPVPTDPEVFAGGDVVRIHGGDGEWPTMQRAIECIWQAKTLARNVLELLAEPPGYPDGVPPLHPHHLRTDFPHGVSIGSRSLIVYGRAVSDLGPISVGFRRWLMRRYFERYAV